MAVAATAATAAIKVVRIWIDVFSRQFHNLLEKTEGDRLTNTRRRTRSQLLVGIANRQQQQQWQPQRQHRVEPFTRTCI